MRRISKCTYVTTLTKKQCAKLIKDNLDGISLSFGEAKLVGWIAFNVFSVSYRSGKIRMYNPIFNKAIGTLTENNGQTHVKFSLYKGLTDFISLSVIFVVSFAILLVSSHELNVFYLIALSLLCCAFAALITFSFTWISEEGEDGEVELLEFLKTNLELRKLD